MPARANDERDTRLLDWIDGFLEEHKFAPTIREVGIAFNLKSTSSVKQWLDRLSREGRVEWNPGDGRTLRTVRWDDPGPF